MTATLITIDASAWRSVLDFYEDVLKHIGAPDWHGQCANALVDSMIYGTINALEPPYIIRFLEPAGWPRTLPRNFDLSSNLSRTLGSNSKVQQGSTPTLHLK